MANPADAVGAGPLAATSSAAQAEAASTSQVPMTDDPAAASSAPVPLSARDAAMHKYRELWHVALEHEDVFVLKKLCKQFQKLEHQELGYCIDALLQERRAQLPRFEDRREDLMPLLRDYAKYLVWRSDGLPEIPSFSFPHAECRDSPELAAFLQSYEEATKLDHFLSLEEATDFVQRHAGEKRAYKLHFAAKPSGRRGAYVTVIKQKRYRDNPALIFRKQWEAEQNLMRSKLGRVRSAMGREEAESTKTRAFLDAAQRHFAPERYFSAKEKEEAESLPARLQRQEPSKAEALKQAVVKDQKAARKAEKRRRKRRQKALEQQRQKAGAGAGAAGQPSHGRPSNSASRGQAATSTPSGGPSLADTSAAGAAPPSAPATAVKSEPQPTPVKRELLPDEGGSNGPHDSKRARHQ